MSEWLSDFLRRDDFVKVMLFNNAVCYYELDMLDQALKCV